MLRTRNNTDGIKVVTFSGIGLHYGNTYSIDQLQVIGIAWYYRDNDFIIRTFNLIKMQSMHEIMNCSKKKAFKNCTHAAARLPH